MRVQGYTSTRVYGNRIRSKRGRFVESKLSTVALCGGERLHDLGVFDAFVLNSLEKMKNEMGTRV